jgi:L-ribulokinase
MGMTLSTKPEEIYRAIVESTAYGARKIVQTFNESGVPVKEFIAAGGLIKNKFVMQIYADVLNMPITVIKSAQGPALGSAIHAAVAAGSYENVQSAAAAMGGVAEERYQPIPANAKVYDELYELYNQLYESFGHNGAMHSLRAIRDRALTGSVK